MTGSAHAHLAAMDLPDFGMPDTAPVLAPPIYAERLAELRARAAERGVDFVVVYADREHSANLSYLSGFDPRFEEALLVVAAEGEPALLVGNECVGMAESAPLPMRVTLFQDFSLPGQPRDRSPALADILSAAGIGHGKRVGVVGWKTFGQPSRFDVPAYIVDDLRDLTTPDLVVNVTDILIDPGEGMRVINEVDQLAYFEYAACQTSHGVRSLVFGVQPGMTEREAVRLLQWNGAPLSCHLMLTAGDRARLGLLSPGDRPIEAGDPLTVAFGIWGALNCRAGFVTTGPAGLPPAIDDYVEKLVRPYFEAVAEWYGALRIGQHGGVLHEIVQRHLGDPFFGIFLNPGHQIHLDEWVNTPVYPGSRIELRSGMAMQVDVIPATGTPYFTTNIEDGIALADRELRQEFATRYPDAWDRIEARRRFMKENIGIDLHPDVLPFSNIPAYLPPFLLAPELAMSLA